MVVGERRTIAGILLARAKPQPWSWGLWGIVVDAIALVVAVNTIAPAVALESITLAVSAEQGGTGEVPIQKCLLLQSTERVLHAIESLRLAGL